MVACENFATVFAEFNCPHVDAFVVRDDACGVGGISFHFHRVARVSVIGSRSQQVAIFSVDQPERTTRLFAVLGRRSYAILQSMNLKGPTEPQRETEVWIYSPPGQG